MSKRKPRPKSHSRLGKDFEGEVSASLRLFKLKKPDFFFHRLADTMDYIRVQNVIMPKQPADFMAVYNGTCYLLEAKSTHKKSFDMDNLKEHQREGLKAIVRARGRGIILFSFRDERPARLFAVNIYDYLHVENQAKLEDRKSVLVEDLIKIGMNIKRIPRVGWDFSDLFI